MRIPVKALKEIFYWLDRVVLIRSAVYGGIEKVVFVCLAKHKMRPANEAIRIRRKGEPSRENRKIPAPVRHEKWIIFLVEDNLVKLSETEKMSVIAEEFALTST